MAQGHGQGPWPLAMAQGHGPGPWPWAMALGHGPGSWPWKTIKTYTHNTNPMSLRPLRGRKPIKMVTIVYMFDSFLVSWKMGENTGLDA